MVEYGDRLKWAMHNKPGGPASVRDLSNALGLSYQAVRKVLIGESHAMTAENNERAATWLGVTSRWLATGRGPRHLPTAPDPRASEPPATYQNAPPHADPWICEAIRTLEAMTLPDRRAAVLNLRVFKLSLLTPGDGQALPMAA